MKCKDFERDVFLFISREISKHKSLKMKNHIKNCEECAAFYKDAVETLKQIENDELYAPGKHIKENVIDFAVSKRIKKSKCNLFNQINQIFSQRYFNPVFSYGALAMIVLLTVLSIFRLNIQPFKKNVNLRWNDNFLMQISNLEHEMNSIEKGENDLALYENLSISSDENVSVFSEDFIDLREQVIEMIVRN